MNPMHSTLDWMRSVHSKMGDQIFSIGARLQTWLVVGNATGLVLTFNTLVSGGHCDARVLKMVSVCFLCGLLTAFALAAGGFALSVRSLSEMNKPVNLVTQVVQNEHLAEELSKVGIETKPGDLLYVDYDRVKHEFSEYEAFAQASLKIAYALVAAQVLSALFFATGTIVPLIYSDELYITCSPAN